MIRKNCTNCKWHNNNNSPCVGCVYDAGKGGNTHFEPDVVVKTASWEKFGKNAYACTNCRRGVTNREKYCPECGSLMRKEGK